MQLDLTSMMTFLKTISSLLLAVVGVRVSVAWTLTLYPWSLVTGVEAAPAMPQSSGNACRY
jgi:hypothetical protein